MIELVQYYTALYDGKIAACEHMKRLSELILNDYEKPGEFHFDPDIAAKHTDFIETFCKIPSGALGAPFKLELFQKARCEAVFGFGEGDGWRRYNEVLIVEGRKNGKTTECGAIEIDMTVNDGEGAPQVYNAATKYDQAALGFNATHKMIQLSPNLAKHFKKRQADLYFAPNMGIIKPLASNTSSLDGLDISCAIVDELAAIKNRDLYDLIKQAMSARRQPLLFCITTNGFVRGGIFDAQIEFAKKALKGHGGKAFKRFLPMLYMLDDPMEWTDRSKWIKANPGLGTIKSEEALEGYVSKAMNDSSFKPTVMVKDFNIPQTAENHWLEWEELNNEEMWDLPIEYGIGGMDASDSIDLSAAVAVFQRPNDQRIYVKAMFWIPQSVIDEENKKGDRRGRDSAPYQQWIADGYLRTVPGARVDKQVMLDWFLELREQGCYMRFIGYDPWHIDDSLLRKMQGEFGKNSVIPVRQGPYTFSEPMKNCKADFREHLIIYNNNPVLKWCLYNAAKQEDINGNWQLVKTTDRTQRIDGAAALLDAYIVLANKRADYVNLNEPAEES